MSARDSIRLSFTTPGARALYGVGASWWQTPGAIDSEIEKIDSEVQAFDAELVAEVRRRGFDPATVHVQGFWDSLEELAARISAPGAAQAAIDVTHAAARQAAEKQKAIEDAAHQAMANVTDPVVRFYIGTWVPFKKGWDAWKGGHSGSWWWNYAPDAEGYQAKLVQLRDTAKKLGMHVTSADPDQEGQSVFDPRRKGVGDAVDEMAKLVKYIAWGAAGLGVIWGGTMIVNTARRR